MPISLSPEALHEVSKLLADADCSRYLGAVGLVALLYDHLLTLPKEISLIWKAPSSAPKYAFLVNRYLVPLVLLAVAYANCGFSVISLNDAVCRKLLIVAAIFAVCSLGLANALVLLRVVVLWENNPRAKIMMTTGFLLSFGTMCIFMAITIAHMESSFRYNGFARMCVTISSTRALIGVWASPLVFEFLVLFATCWNALDRPTHASVPLVKALRRDGILFFVVLTMLRSINLALAATMRPEMVLLLVFFVWASTTLVLNRSLLSLQRATALDNLRQAISRSPRSCGTRVQHFDDDESDTEIYQELETWKARAAMSKGSGFP